MSKLIIMSGIPGAGKTTYANSIKDAYVVSNDIIRFRLTKGVFLSQKEWNNLPIDPIQEKLIISSSKRYSVVILDCTALTNKKRLEYYNKYKRYFDEFEIIYINTSLFTCIYRNSKRVRQVPIWQIIKLRLKWEPFNSEIKKLFKVYTVRRNDIYEIKSIFS